MRSFIRVVVLGLAGVSAAACTNPSTNGPAEAFDVHQAFPISVEPEVATLVVQIDEGLQSLARGEHERVRAFAERWKVRGHGVLNASSPSGASNQAAAAIALEEVKAVLTSNGVVDGSVQYTSYRAGEGDTKAPITLSFVTYVASTPNCGTDWSENIGFSPRNQPWPEFGCSTQKNFAASVADPRDLVEPRAIDSADANRRSTVFEKYRAGLPTATPPAGAADSGQVSTMGQ
jgi:pilus assembly protein CpaD